MENLITPPQAAEIVGCSRGTASRLCRTHGIGRRLGRYYYLTPADVERLRSAYQGQAGNPLFGTVYVGKKKLPKKP